MNIKFIKKHTHTQTHTHTPRHLPNMAENEFFQNTQEYNISCTW